MSCTVVTKKRIDDKEQFVYFAGIQGLAEVTASLARPDVPARRNQLKNEFKTCYEYSQKYYVALVFACRSYASYYFWGYSFKKDPTHEMRNACRAFFKKMGRRKGVAANVKRGTRRLDELKTRNITLQTM